MDMAPATDFALESYPHVFLTVCMPWDPNCVDKEFLTDPSLSFIDDHDIQTHCNACDPYIGNYGDQHHLPDIDALFPTSDGLEKNVFMICLRK